MFNFLNLKSGVGEGEENREEDVKSLSKSLGDLGDAEVQQDGWSKNGFVSKPLFDGVKRLQDQNGVKVDGIVRPEGQTEQIVNNRIAGKPRGAGLLDNLPGPLTDSVGAGGINRGADVSSVKRSLGALGHMAEDPYDRPNGVMTAKTDQAIRQFQRGKGLKEDGLLYAHGPTMKSLDTAVTRLSDEKRANWKRFHDQVAAFNQTQARPLFPPQESGGDEGVVPAQLRLRRGTGAGAPGTRPGHRPLPPFNRENWMMTPKGPLPNLFKGLGELLDGSQKPEPGRKPTKLPPATMKGPDVSKKPDGYRGTVKPATPPKLPEKKAPPNLDDIRKGAIEFFPDQSDTLRLPVLVESRLGKASTIEQNKKIVDITMQEGKNVFGRGIKQIGGPGYRNNNEYFVPNRDKEKLGLKSNKGASFADNSFAVTAQYKGKDETVQVHVDTYTAKKRDARPTAEEDKRFVRFEYNLEKNAIIIRVPKENAGWRFEDSFYRSVINRLLSRTKSAIEAGHFSERRTWHKVVEYLIDQKP